MSTETLSIQETEDYRFPRGHIAATSEYTRGLWTQELDRLNDGGDENGQYSAAWLRGYTEAQAIIIDQLRDESFNRETLIAGFALLIVIGGDGSEFSNGYLSALKDTAHDLNTRA